MPCTSTRPTSSAGAAAASTLCSCPAPCRKSKEARRHRVPTSGSAPTPSPAACGTRWSTNTPPASPRPTSRPKKRTTASCSSSTGGRPHITLAQLHTIQAPSLIMAGDHDVISLPHTLVIYQNIPHAQLWIVPNSGHPTVIEHADEVNKKVDEFFTQSFMDFRPANRTQPSCLSSLFVVIPSLFVLPGRESAFVLAFALSVLAVILTRSGRIPPLFTPPKPPEPFCRECPAFAVSSAMPVLPVWHSRRESAFAF